MSKYWAICVVVLPSVLSVWQWCPSWSVAWWMVFCSLSPWVMVVSIVVIEFGLEFLAGFFACGEVGCGGGFFLCHLHNYFFLRMAGNFRVEPQHELKPYTTSFVGLWLFLCY